MPQDSIRTLVMSAEKDAVKRFLSHMHQSWDQLQVETGQVCSEIYNWGDHNYPPPPPQGNCLGKITQRWNSKNTIQSYLRVCNDVF